MVRFSDLLGRDGNDDDDNDKNVDENELLTVTPTEPVPPPPTEPPPPPPSGSSPSNDLLDRLTTFASARGAAQEAEPKPEPEPEPEPAPSRFGLPPELLENPGYEPVTATVVSETPYVDTLAPVDDDLLPRRHSK
jgi:hypothetical protein